MSYLISWRCCSTDICPGRASIRRRLPLIWINCSITISIIYIYWGRESISIRVISWNRVRSITWIVIRYLLFYCLYISWKVLIICIRNSNSYISVFIIFSNCIGTACLSINISKSYSITWWLPLISKNRACCSITISHFLRNCKGLSYFQCSINAETCITWVVIWYCYRTGFYNFRKRIIIRIRDSNFYIIIFIIFSNCIGTACLSINICKSYSITWWLPLISKSRACCSITIIYILRSCKGLSYFQCSINAETRITWVVIWYCYRTGFYNFRKRIIIRIRDSNFYIIIFIIFSNCIGTACLSINICKSYSITWWLPLISKSRACCSITIIYILRSCKGLSYFQCSINAETRITWVVIWYCYRTGFYDFRKRIIIRIRDLNSYITIFIIFSNCIGTAYLIINISKSYSISWWLPLISKSRACCSISIICILRSCKGLSYFICSNDWICCHTVITCLWGAWNSIWTYFKLDIWNPLLRSIWVFNIKPIAGRMLIDLIKGNNSSSYCSRDVAIILMIMFISSITSNYCNLITFFKWNCRKSWSCCKTCLTFPQSFIWYVSFIKNIAEKIFFG